jgi:tRNA dimethylallyltransferase
VFLLDLPRDVLYARINARVDAMIAAGLVEEVQSLLARGFTERDPGMNATGYVEMIPYLRGEYDLASAIDAIKRSTRRYARRQITWLRHQLPADTVHLDALQPVDVLADHIALRWRHAAARAGAQT